MKFLNRIGALWVIGILLVIGVVGCTEDSADNPPPPGDNSDTGTSLGIDTGTGVEEWDTSPLPGVNLMPNEEGFMKTENNELGIQGAWYTFGCDGAVYDPPEGATFNNPGRMCFSGTAPQVIDADTDGSPDYSDIWGAGMGFDVCGQSAEEAGGSEPVQNTLSACPYNENLVNEIIGVRVRFSGYVNASEFRILFNEGISVANSYYIIDPADVTASTVIEVEFEDDENVRTWYDEDLKPSNTVAANIIAIQFQIPTNDATPVDWDFCVDAISAITAQ